MLHESGLGDEIFALLFQWDEEIARAVASSGCPFCGGRLHYSNYLRKPRGGRVAAAGEASRLRHSLCCGRHGCRKRSLPPSLRFLGKRVYVEAAVLIASLCAQLAASVREASAATGVPCWTLRRWGTWWRQKLPALPLWSTLRARFVPPPPEDDALPKSLLERVESVVRSVRGSAASSAGDVILLVARLLAPATTQSVSEGSRFVGVASARLATEALPQKM